MSKQEKAANVFSEKYPHYRTYAKCQSQAFMTGLFTFVAGGSVVYIGQELLKSKLPYDRRAFIVAPVIIGTIAAYYVTRKKTKLCQQMWMAIEDKHTALTPIGERKS